MSGTIRGTVVDDATAAPIDGVMVTVNVTGGPHTDVTTDAAGTYTAAGLDAGAYMVRFVDPTGGHMTEYNGGNPVSPGTLVTVVDAETTIVDAGLAPAATFTGSCVGPTGPVANVAVRVLSAVTGGAYRTVRSLADGSWSMPMVPIRPWKVRYDATGYLAQYHDGVPTSGTSGLAAATVITPAPYVTTTLAATMKPV